MNNEQRLEAILAQFRQKLADEQLRSTSLAVMIEELQAKIVELEGQKDVEQEGDTQNFPDPY